MTHFTVENLEFRSAIVCLSSKKSLEKIKNAEEKPPQIKQEDIFLLPRVIKKLDHVLSVDVHEHATGRK